MGCVICKLLCLIAIAFRATRPPYSGNIIFIELIFSCPFLRRRGDWLITVGGRSLDSILAWLVVILVAEACFCFIMVRWGCRYLGSSGAASTIASYGRRARAAILAWLLFVGVGGVRAHDRSCFVILCLQERALFFEVHCWPGCS